MSMWTDPSEVIDLEFKVCWTGAGRLHVTAVMPSCRREVWPFSEAALHQTHQGQIDLDVQSRQLSLFCTFPNHAPFWFFFSLPKACDLVHYQRAFCSNSPLRVLLFFFCLSRRFGQAWSSLAQSLSTLRRKAAKWHPRGNQKHALASLSLVWEIISDYVQFLALHRLQANTQACMKARRGIKNVFWGSFNLWSPGGGGDFWLTPAHV